MCHKTKPKQTKQIFYEQPSQSSVYVHNQIIAEKAIFELVRKLVSMSG